MNARAYQQWLALFLLLACSRGSLAEEPSAPIKPRQIFELSRTNPLAKPPVVTAVAIRPGGTQIATGGDDHQVRLWSVEEARLQFTLKGHRDWVRSLAYSPDGSMLASAGDCRHISLWDTQTGKQIRTLTPHELAVYALSFSPDGNMLAAVGFERKVRVYDPHSGTLLHQFDGPCSDLRAVAFSPDSSQLAVVGRNGQIQVWIPNEGKLVLEIGADVERVRTLAYSLDGSKIITSGEGRNICIWDAHSGQDTSKFHCRPAKVLALVVCGPAMIATGGSDNTVRLWDLNQRKEHAQLLGHTGSIAALAYDPASHILVSGSYDTTVRVWKLEPGDRQRTAQPTAPDFRTR